MARPTIDELCDREEIRDLFTLYTHQHDVLAPRFASGEADGTEFDVFHEIFTSDGEIDFTFAGGFRGHYEIVAGWMAKAYALFPVQHHVMGQTQYRFSDDRASCSARTWLINPMGFGNVGEDLQVFAYGGYYLDELVRGDDGWRIRYRLFEPQWMMGDVPTDLVLPEPPGGDGTG